MRITSLLLLSGLPILLLGCGRRQDTPPEAPEVGGVTGESASVAEQEERIHPEFSLTLPALELLLEDLPPAQRERILDEPRQFLELTAELLETPEELLWLVDKEHPLPAEYEPRDLVELDTLEERLTLTREGLSLRRLVLEDLLAMVGAAGEEGVELPISSTYRSYDYQEWLFDYWVEELGLEEAERSSARPGTSQHQLGTTIDFGSISDAFAETDAGVWLAENGRRFGFSLSYPKGYEELTGYKWESWHFRYLGRAATEMERRFFGGIQQRMLEFWSARRDELAEAWSGGP
ncbi:MAG: M15 family metallopeptidase [Spirochaetaceae bacterium]